MPRTKRQLRCSSTGGFHSWTSRGQSPRRWIGSAAFPVVLVRSCWRLTPPPATTSQRSSRNRYASFLPCFLLPASCLLDVILVSPDSRLRPRRAGARAGALHGCQVAGRLCPALLDRLWPRVVATSL